MRGVGGPFNPATLDVVEGYLATASDNVDGCEAFEQRFEGAILLVKRGNCFFQVWYFESHGRFFIPERLAPCCFNRPEMVVLLGSLATLTREQAGERERERCIHT